MNKGIKICPICNQKDTYVIWKEMFHNKPLKIDSFCCHHCGYYIAIRGEIWEDQESSMGIVINPRIVPTKRQFKMFKKALKKDSKSLGGLRITDQFPYMPPKN